MTFITIAAAETNYTRTAEAVSARATALRQRAIPLAAQLGWEVLDSAITASLWTFDAGVRFREWSEDPHNQERANQIAARVAIVGNNALDTWCFVVAATIEAGYRSRPYVEKGYTRLREYLVAASTLIRFVLALRQWLQRLDCEEVELYQTALPPAPAPMALLAPVLEIEESEGDPWLAPLERASMVPAPVAVTIVASTPTPLLLAPAPQPAQEAATASKPKSRKAKNSTRKKEVSERKSVLLQKRRLVIG